MKEVITLSFVEHITNEIVDFPQKVPKVESFEIIFDTNLPDTRKEIIFSLDEKGRSKEGPIPDTEDNPNENKQLLYYMNMNWGIVTILSWGTYPWEIRDTILDAFVMDGFIYQAKPLGKIPFGTRKKYDYENSFCEDYFVYRP
jgi:hypothetical protein